MKSREQNKPLKENWVKTDSHDHRWQAIQLLKKAKQIESSYKGKREVKKIDKGFTVTFVELKKQ